MLYMLFIGKYIDIEIFNIICLCYDKGTSGWSER